MKARRALLSGGGRSDGGADLDDVPLLSVEAKRVERLDVRGALRQAIRAAEKNGRVPLVVTRQNRMATGDSIVAMRLSDFLVFYSKAVDCSSA